MTHPDTLIPRAVVEQAIETLDEATSYTSSPAWSPSMTNECKDMVAQLRAALQPQAADQDPNSPWLSEAHMLCSDQGIPHGDITERIEALRDKLAAAEPYKTQLDKTGSVVVDTWAAAEPVAWEYENSHGMKFLTFENPIGFNGAVHGYKEFTNFRPLGYTTPPATQAENPLLKDYVEKTVAAERRKWQAALTAALDFLWVVVEHNRLHFGDTHNTVIQGKAAIAQIEALGVKHGSV